MKATGRGAQHDARQNLHGCPCRDPPAGDLELLGELVLSANHARVIVGSPQTYAGSEALCRTRTDDPLLTMEVLYQLS